MGTLAVGKQARAAVAAGLTVRRIDTQVIAPRLDNLRLEVALLAPNDDIRAHGGSRSRKIAHIWIEAMGGIRHQVRPDELPFQLDGAWCLIQLVRDLAEAPQRERAQ